MKNLQIKILHIENDQIQSLLTSVTLSTVLIAIRKLSAEHRGGELLLDFRAQVPSNSTNHRQKLVF